MAQNCASMRNICAPRLGIKIVRCSPRSSRINTAKLWHCRKRFHCAIMRALGASEFCSPPRPALRAAKTAEASVNVWRSSLSRSSRRLHSAQRTPVARRRCGRDRRLLLLHGRGDPRAPRYRAFLSPAARVGSCRRSVDMWTVSVVCAVPRPFPPQRSDDCVMGLRRLPLCLRRLEGPKLGPRLDSGDARMPGWCSVRKNCHDRGENFYNEGRDRAIYDPTSLLPQYFRCAGGLSSICNYVN